MNKATQRYKNAINKQSDYMKMIRDLEKQYQEEILPTGITKKGLKLLKRINSAYETKMNHINREVNIAKKLVLEEVLDA